MTVFFTKPGQKYYLIVEYTNPKTFLILQGTKVFNETCIKYVVFFIHRQHASGSFVPNPHFILCLDAKIEAFFLSLFVATKSNQKRHTA